MKREMIIDEYKDAMREIRLETAEELLRILKVRKTLGDISGVARAIAELTAERAPYDSYQEERESEGAF